MTFSKSVMGRGVVHTNSLGFKIQPSEKTLAESIARMQKAEEKKLTFDEWCTANKKTFENFRAFQSYPGSYYSLMHLAWQAAQENL